MFFDAHGRPRSLLSSWTDVQAADAFAQAAGGRSWFRIDDLLRLREVIQEVGVDSRTGEIIERPAVQYTGTDRAGKPFTMAPDPGFSYNPGRAWSLWDKNGHLSDCIGGAEFAAFAAPRQAVNRRGAWTPRQRALLTCC